MTTKWSHLPNAAHIDAVLASLQAHPQQWANAWNKTYPNDTTVARNAAWDAALDAAWNAARSAVWDVARNAAWNAARAAAWDAARIAARYAAWYAITALIAYDDCAYLLESAVDELRILAALGDPRAVLLVPACLALSMIKEKAIA